MEAGPKLARLGVELSSSQVRETLAPAAQEVVATGAVTYGETDGRRREQRVGVQKDVECIIETGPLIRRRSGVKRIGGTHVDRGEGRRGRGGENEGSSVSEHGCEFTGEEEGRYGVV